MNRLKRLSRSFALLLGSLGVVVCVAAFVVVWAIGSRLNQANEDIFAKIDKSLATARDRVLGAQKRVQQSKITTEDIGESVKNWAQRESSERIASQLEIEKRAEQLAANLQQVDLWLELSGDSIQGVKQLLEIASSLGVHVDTLMVNPLAEKLDALQRQLKQSADMIDAIHERLGKATGANTLDERMNQVAQLALRIVGTLGQTDSRLGEFADKLGDIQNKAERLKSKTHLYLVISQACAVLLIAWMAAGQVSLCRNGWKNLSQIRSVA